MGPVLQGSALSRASEHGFTSIQADRERIATAILSAKLLTGSCARDSLTKVREPVSVLLDFGSMAIRLNGAGIAGVCPMAGIRTRLYKYPSRKVAKRTAIHSRSVTRFVRKGLEGCAAATPAGRSFPEGDGLLVTT
jgi:hypothetical protein